MMQAMLSAMLNRLHMASNAPTVISVLNRLHMASNAPTVISVLNRLHMASNAPTVISVFTTTMDLPEEVCVCPAVTPHTVLGCLPSH
jgi:hypothetical protein